MNLPDKTNTEILCHLRHSSELDIYIFYKNLKEDPEGEIASLLNYFNLRLSENDRAHVFEEISFNKMKKNNLGYVITGKYYGWQEDLSKDQCGRILHRCYFLLKALNYPLDKPGGLPQLKSEAIEHLTNL